MNYDIKSISNKYNFSEKITEKVLRISDVLESVSNVEFLRKRLSLYGGTALNFIHFQKIPRLSVDLDFNYRHIGENDWGKVRDELETKLKKYYI